MEQAQHNPQPAHLAELPVVQSVEQSMLTAQHKLYHEVSQHDVTKHALATSQSTCQLWEVAYRQLEAQFITTRELLADSNAKVDALSIQVSSLEDTLKLLKPQIGLPAFTETQTAPPSSLSTCTPQLIAPVPSNTVMQIGTLLAENVESRRLRSEQSHHAEELPSSPSHSI